VPGSFSQILAPVIDIIIGGTYQGLVGLSPQIFMNKLFQTRAKTTIEATVSTSTAKIVFHTHTHTHMRTPCLVTVLLYHINLELLTY